MLFDEATSALDNIHEDEIQYAIDLASEGFTTITIAQRLSTVKNSDRIIVLDEGRIVEERPPDELLGKEGGRFQKLYNDQRVDLLAHQQPLKPNLVSTASLVLGHYYRPQIVLEHFQVLDVMEIARPPANFGAVGFCLFQAVIQNALRVVILNFLGVVFINK